MTAGRRPELERRRAEREPRQAANRSAAAAGVAFAVPQTRAQASREIGRPEDPPPVYSDRARL